MDWIKKNYDQAALGACALLLCALSAFLIFQVMAFQHVFDDLKNPSSISRNVAPVDASTLAKARQALDNPAQWTPPPKGSLFVSDPYIVFNGQLVDPKTTPIQFHPPVPNQWFFDHGIDPLEPTALEDDPDGDGFSNQDEFTWKTDPQDPKSHPAYWTKLRLARFIKIPFRLKFAAYDADSFQINTLDVKQPSQFLHIGDDIAGTKFKILSFDKKSHTDPNGVLIDDSELLIQNTETSEKLTLILDKVIDSPDSYGLFKYLWKGNIDLQVKKNKTFSVTPETDVQYKLVDINEAEALIQNAKTGEKIKIAPGGAEKAP